MPVKEPSLPDLVESLRLAQRERWQKGDRVVVESYLALHPRLRADETSLLHLVYNEVLLREAAGESPSLEEYVRRFPQLAGQLSPLFEVHRALESDQLLGVVVDQPCPAGKLPEKPAAQLTATVDDPVTERPGTVIGPYKLLQQIGEGGMGTVYMAEQSHPVQRKVALKVIKPGMDSRQVIARFEAERQALALMDHPNIAKVLDAGTINGERGHVSAPSTRGADATPLASADATRLAGRPYFVMELVKGVPITRYCDEHHLTPRERLELFVPVCQAIQHAHQKGIIHRDIKPSNVMVCIYDGKPVPKVIDFGVAKATGPKLTEQTLYTEFGAIVGTFEYMSPEQAQLDQLDIDTRSDIYSLGVLLYELLTGTTPLERKRLKEVAVLELLRLVREEEAPRPSTRLSTAEALPSIAANRGTEPKKLTGLMRGELDWVVMKCLEKDRDRRYETANGLAQDIERHLHDEPVQACPPSAGYRLRKFVRRNKGPVLAATVALVALVGGVVGMTWGVIRAEQARQAEARQRALAEVNEQKALKEKGIAEAVRTFLQRDLLRQANPAEQADAVRQAGGEFVATENPTVKELLDRAAVDLMPGKVEAKFSRESEVQAPILQTVGTTYWAIGESAKAIDFLTRSSDIYRAALGSEHPDTLATLDYLAWAYQLGGKTTEAVALFDQVRDVRLKTLGPDHPDTLTSLDNLAGTYQSAGRTGEAVALFEKVRDARVKALGADHADTLITLHNLALAYLSVGKTAEAISMFEQVRDTREKKLGADHPFTLLTLQSLAGARLSAGKTAEAIALFDQVGDTCAKKLGVDHPITLVTLHHRAQAYRTAGRMDKAIALYKEVRDACAKKLGGDHPLTLATLDNLGRTYLLTGKSTEAIALFEQVRDARLKKLGSDHPYTLLTMNNLGDSYVAVGEPGKAVAILQEALALRERRVKGDPSNGSEQSFLAWTHGQIAEAERARLDYAAAVKAYATSVEIFEKLDRTGALNNQFFRGALSEYRQRLALCRKAGQAVGDLDFALKQPGPEVPRLLDVRLRSLLKEQKLPAAINTAAKIKELAGDKPDQLYDAACAYALCAAEPGGVSAGSKPRGADATPLAKKCAQEAMALLKQAVAKGFKNAAHIKQDKDLVALREREDFKKLVTDLEAAKKD
jgi:serine/threonine protein kinase/tetratricopeptide (TPR) repeat protein